MNKYFKINYKTLTILDPQTKTVLWFFGGYSKRTFGNKTGFHTASSNDKVNPISFDKNTYIHLSHHIKYLIGFRKYVEIVIRHNAHNVTYPSISRSDISLLQVVPERPFFPDLFNHAGPWIEPFVKRDRRYAIFPRISKIWWRKNTYYIWDMTMPVRRKTARVTRTPLWVES